MPRIKYATKEQIDALLAASYSDVRDHAILTLMFWRGLRASEVGMLRLEDYNRADGRLYVHRAKGSLSAEYLLSPQERKAMDAWTRVRGTDPGPLFVSRKRGPITRQQLHRMVQRYARKAGWPEELCHPHTLRHSVAVHLVEQGVDLLAIKDWLGHKAITSTTVYAQITNKARDAVAERVYSASEPAVVKVNWSRNRRGRRRTAGSGASS
jgi:site-specific recombinase XerD